MFLFFLAILPLVCVCGHYKLATSIRVKLTEMIPSPDMLFSVKIRPWCRFYDFMTIHPSRFNNSLMSDA